MTLLQWMRHSAHCHSGIYAAVGLLILSTGLVWALLEFNPNT